jgi:hypothetical protein
MPTVQAVPRGQPLTASAALGVGAAAFALVERLLELEPERLARLRGVASARTVLVLGSRDDLPWCEGIGYLGHDPDAPELLVPCAVTPDVPAPLLLRALELRFAAKLRPPCAVWLEPPLVLSVAGAQTVDPACLRSWRERALVEGGES